MSEVGVKNKGGRPVGTHNKRDVHMVEIRQLVQKYGDTLPVLFMVAHNDWAGLGYESPTITKRDSDGNEWEEDRITMQMRILAAKESANYIHPKKRAIEITIPKNPQEGAEKSATQALLTEQASKEWV